MPSIAIRNPAPTVVQDDLDLPQKFPDLPDDVLARFPSLQDWEESDAAGWWSKTYNAIQGNNRFVSQSVTKANTNIGDLRVSIAGATAAITTETNARIAADEILAQRIVTVSAIAGVAQNITIQGTPPGAPAISDYWVDNSDPLTPVTFQWNGAAWVEVTDPISVAAVAAEQTARITADGYLSGKYSLTVIAGNVVTGMNITSASGPGVDISSVIFRATDFQIYNGTIGKTMFEVSGATVNLAGTLTVSTSGKVFIGTGTYGATNTAWYVDSAGKFSLKDKLTWDGTTLTITGSISATTGTIGGWTVGSTTLTGGSATLDSTGQLILGTSNNVVYLSASDATYRLWIGNATAASAAFSVTKAGAIFSTSGTVGGWTLSSSTLSANNAILDSAGQLVLGTSNDVVYLSATNVTYRIWVGNATAGSAAFSVTKAGALFSTSGTIGGWTIGSTSLTAGNTQLNSSGDAFFGGNVLIFDNASYHTWQGDAGVNQLNYRSQNSSVAAGAAFLGVGSGTPTVYMARTSGSYGAFSSFTGGILGQWSASSYNGASWDLVSRWQSGTISSNNTPYAFFNIVKGDNSLTSAIALISDGKVYFCGTNAFSAGALGPIAGGSAPYLYTPYANLYCETDGLLQTDHFFAAVSGPNAGSVQSKYAGNIIHRNNATSKYGLFVGTNWAAVENKTLTVANVDATTGTATEYFNIYGNGQAGFSAGSGAAPGISFISDLASGFVLSGASDFSAYVGGTRYMAWHSSKIVCYQDLQLKDAYTAGDPTTTGYLLMRDGAGTMYEVPAKAH